MRPESARRVPNASASSPVAIAGLSPCRGVYDRWMATPQLERTSGSLVGRERECAAIDRLLEVSTSRREQLPRAARRGRDGQDGTAEARRGARLAARTVLRTTGVEAESDLAFAGLYGLLRPIVGQAGRAAHDAGGRAGRGARARSVGWLGPLAGLGGGAEPARGGRPTTAPLLCLIDDAQFLDTASAEALVFSARRLGAEPVAMLFAVREGEARTFEAPGVPDLVLEGIAAEPAVRLLRESAPGRGRPRPRVAACRGGWKPARPARAAEGLVRGAAGGSRRSARGDPVDRPAAVGLRAARRPFAGGDPHRVADRGARRRRARWPRWCGAAGETGLPDDALDSAEQAGLLRVVGGRIDFRHPLVRSALLESSTLSQRRAAHAALAAALSGDRGRRPPRLAPGAGRAESGRRGRRGARSVSASLRGARGPRLGRNGVRPRGRAERRRGPPNRPARGRRRGGVGRRAARARPRADRAGAPAHDRSARERSSCICAA